MKNEGLPRRPVWRAGRGLLCAAVLTLLLGACAGGYEPVPAVTVAVATDLHYLSGELTDNGALFQKVVDSGDGKDMLRCEELTDAFVQAVIARQPKALILSGDLTFNGEYESHVALCEKLRRIEEAGVDVLVIPGNHDLSSSMALRFEGDGYERVRSISAAEFVQLYGAFGFDKAISRDPLSLSYTYQLQPGLRVLMLDVNSGLIPGLLLDDTLEWARQQLKEARKNGEYVLAVSHQNLLEHSGTLSSRYTVTDGEKLLKEYERYGVIANLSGHIHVQHIAESEKGLPELVTASLLASGRQYGILTLEGNRGSYYTVGIDPETPFGGAGDPFWETAFRQAEAEVEGQADAQALSAFFADVNTAYFAGRTDLIQWDEKLLARWEESGSFYGGYLRGIYEEGGQNSTEYSFSFG